MAMSALWLPLLVIPTTAAVATTNDDTTGVTVSGGDLLQLETCHIARVIPVTTTFTTSAAAILDASAIVVKSILTFAFTSTATIGTTIGLLALATFATRAASAPLLLALLALWRAVAAVRVGGRGHSA
uniref:Uncharacterized protein n=1 Tax=Florenciella parvula TaxID=236787 RepID=A0A7S2FXG6_9STRA